MSTHPLVRSLVLLAPLALAAPAAAQNLENGTGSGPSQQLSVPPNERNDPAFSYGAASDPRRTTAKRATPARQGRGPVDRDRPRAVPPDR